MIEIIVSHFDFDEEEYMEFTSSLIRAYNSFPIIQNNVIPPKVLFEEEYVTKSKD